MEIRIVGNDVMLKGSKIGWIEGHRLFDENGRKVGYCEGHYIYNSGGRKVGYVQGSRVETYDGTPGFPLDDVREKVIGGTYPDLMRAAIRLLLLSH